MGNVIKGIKEKQEVLEYTMSTVPLEIIAILGDKNGEIVVHSADAF